MSAIALTGVVAASRLWPADDPEIVPHMHERLAPNDPHLAEIPADARA